MQFETRLIDIIQRTPDVKSFRFETKEAVLFKPGQFFLVTIKVKGKKVTKHFSFSNSPTEKSYIEFTKKITESSFSRALDTLKKGDWAELKMPFGSFTFEGEYKKVAFLSGGIGITPIRSMCKFAIDKKLDTDMVLLYGNEREENILFRKELDDMQEKNRVLRIVYTLTTPPANSTSWKGRLGYIDDKMIRQEVSDYEERIFYACGPPKMVQNLTGILRDKLSIKEDRIKAENFVGY